MMKKYGKLLKTVLVTVFLLGCFGLVLTLNCTAGREDARQDALQNQDYFKNFKLTGPDGETFTQEDLRNYKVTVVNGWAPWCTYCVQEMPDLEILAEEYREKGLQIVGLVADYKWQELNGNDMDAYDGKIRDAVSNTGVTYPIVLEDQAFYDALQLVIGGFPATWAVDSEGNLLEYKEGAESIDDWRKIFDSWLLKAEN